MITAHLSVLALPANGTSVSHHVRTALQVLEASSLRFEVHAMGTEIECERLADLFQVLERIDAALVNAGAKRVTLQVKIDDRRDKEGGLREKVTSVEGKRS